MNCIGIPLPTNEVQKFFLVSVYQHKYFTVLYTLVDQLKVSVVNQFS